MLANRQMTPARRPLQPQRPQFPTEPLVKCSNCGEALTMDALNSHVCQRTPQGIVTGYDPRAKIRGGARSEPSTPQGLRDQQRPFDNYPPSSAPPRPQPTRYGTAPPLQSRTRNPPPPNILIPPPRMSPASPQNGRASSVRSLGSNLSGLPTGPRGRSMEESRSEGTGMVRRRPSNDSQRSMNPNPARYGGAPSGPAPKSADPRLMSSPLPQRQPPPSNPLPPNPLGFVSATATVAPFVQGVGGGGGGEGGQVNMAGVGRRGFKAAAEAIVAADRFGGYREASQQEPPEERAQQPMRRTPSNEWDREPMRRPSTDRERERDPMMRRTPSNDRESERMMRRSPSNDQTRRSLSSDRRPMRTPSDSRDASNLPNRPMRTPSNERDRRGQGPPPSSYASLREREKTRPAELRREVERDNGYLTTGGQSGSGLSSQGASTPPLSPALSSPSTPSLKSPISSPVDSPEPSLVTSPTRTPSNGSSSARDKLRGLRIQDEPPSSKQPPSVENEKEAPPPPPPPAAEKPATGGGFLERYRNLAASATGVVTGLGALASLVGKKEETQTQTQTQTQAQSPAVPVKEEEEEEETMLAYGRDSDDEKEEEEEEENAIVFPAKDSDRSSSKSRSRSGSSEREPESKKKSLMSSGISSTSSSYSTSSHLFSNLLSHINTNPYATSQRLDPLLETSEPNTPLPGPAPVPESLIRARTQSAPKEHKRNKSSGNVKYCVKCDKRIDDGRWIASEGGVGVLCEGCWKGMYLPRCRRCDLPIEKGAVSSSDGQLKGKWHKDCFTCFTCGDPFPSKTFYVHSNNPYCAYHYAELNDSLCSCGDPIEGECAVAHGGERFHPDCFVCERSGCGQRLGEGYWEIDGERVCEKHAGQLSPSPSRSEFAREELDGVGELGGLERRRTGRGGTSRAQKRTTRYIELGEAGGPTSGSGPATGNGRMGSLRRNRGF